MIAAGVVVMGDGEGCKVNIRVGIGAEVAFLGLQALCKISKDRRDMIKIAFFIWLFERLTLSAYPKMLQQVRSLTCDGDLPYIFEQVVISIYF